MIKDGVVMAVWKHQSLIIQIGLLPLLVNRSCQSFDIKKLGRKFAQKVISKTQEISLSLGYRPVV